MGAGDLRDRFTIQRNTATADWTGHPATPNWQDQFTVWGNIQYMRGGEAVIAARLTARQPAILTVRVSSQTKGILPTDRVKNARTGELFNIREQPRVSKDNRGYLEVLVEAGASDG